MLGLSMVLRKVFFVGWAFGSGGVWNCDFC
jgi:hypothetical protein